MKITKQSLKQIIREEYNKLVNEAEPKMITIQEPGGGSYKAPAPAPEQGDERRVGRSGSSSFTEARENFIKKFLDATKKPFSRAHAQTYENIINRNPPDGKIKHVKAFEAYVKDPSEQNLENILNMFSF